LKPVSRPTWVEIDLAALQHNFNAIRTKLGQACEVLAVVKADAYGHGVRQVAPALAEAGTAQFGVALVEEGIELRQLDIEQPIVVLGGVFPGEESLVLEHNLTPVIYDMESARRLAAACGEGQAVDYHLKVDTGMGRLGFRLERLPQVLAELKALPQLRMVGLMSHLAVADESSNPFTLRQYESFRGVIEQVEQAGFSPRYRHIANSAGTYAQELAGCTLVRPGIALYGGLVDEPFNELASQRPVMSFHSSIAQLKDVPAGEGVSYGHRFTTSRPSRLAALPVGYADGYNRLLSNCGSVLIKGHRAPVVGTVCMDWILVDVTDIPQAQVGDQVTLIGRDGDAVITAEEWAEKIGSINYEVFCQVSKRVPRVFV